MVSLPAEENKSHTYGDYLTWSEDERWELIGGKPYNMTPAPSRRHQDISRELVTQTAAILKDLDTGCIVYAAPFDVRLPESDEANEDIFNVVQPDMALICDRSKLDERGCRGAPDWIVEIISPATAAKDRINKLALYEKHGVKEYWIVDPFHNMVTVRSLDKSGRYGPAVDHEGKGELSLSILPELRIDLDAVFKTW